MLTKAFWRATTERVLASTAGAALAAMGSDAIDVLNIDVKGVVSVAVGAGLVSLLKGIAAAKFTGGGPSLNNAETLAPPQP